MTPHDDYKRARQDHFGSDPLPLNRFIPPQVGRPERDTIISKGEIVDLKILLNTKSAEEFIKEM